MPDSITFLYLCADCNGPTKLFTLLLLPQSFNCLVSTLQQHMHQSPVHCHSSVPCGGEICAGAQMLVPWYAVSHVPCLTCLQRHTAPLKLTAEQVIRQMYENINVRNVEGAMEYIDDECVYQVSVLSNVTVW